MPTVKNDSGAYKQKMRIYRISEVLFMKIAVLCGGRSCERDVSLVTGAQAAKALRENGHKVVLLDACSGLDTDIPAAEIFDKELPIENYTIAEASPDVRPFFERPEGFFGKNVIEICKNADIVFNALHGGEGENGKVQAAFDLMNIKYTGSGECGCLLAMDKWLSKNVFRENGIPVPKAVLLNREDLEKKDFVHPEAGFAFPCVVKPVSLGSSVGVSIVKNHEQLDSALKKAFEYGSKVLVEEYIKGREFGVSVVGNQAYPAIEIIPKNGFYDYKNKYQPQMTCEICPAQISEALAERMGNIALKAFAALGLKAYTRFDFIIDAEENIYCLEANTLPGMTPISLLPQEARAAGVSFNELLEIIIKESLA